MVGEQASKGRPDRIIIPFSHEVVGGVSSSAIQKALQPEYAMSLLGRLAEKSAWTYLHSIRVGLLVTGLVDSRDTSVAALSDEDKIDARRAGFLHDVGKLKVPTKILNKSGRPDKKEFKKIKKHPKAGFEMLKAVDKRVAQIVVGHHEHQGERSYPRKPAEVIVFEHPERRVVEEEILTIQRVLAVSDTVDALTVRRPYPKWSEDGNVVSTSTEPWAPQRIHEELIGTFGKHFSKEFLAHAVDLGKAVTQVPLLQKAQRKAERQLLLV